MTTKCSCSFVNDLVASRPDLARRAGIQSVPSHWMDASHKEWVVGSLLDKFKGAIASNDYRGRGRAWTRIECIKVISAAYLSASLSSREVAIVDARPPTRENGARSNGHHRAAPSRHEPRSGWRRKAPQLSGLLSSRCPRSCWRPTAYVSRSLVVRSIRGCKRESSTVLFGRFPIEAFHWALRGVWPGSVTQRRVAGHADLDLARHLCVSLPLAAFGNAASGRRCALVRPPRSTRSDGIVAREAGVLRSTPVKWLDAVVDRYADAAPLAGLAVFYRAVSTSVGAGVGGALGVHARELRARKERGHESVLPRRFDAPSRANRLILTSWSVARAAACALPAPQWTRR